MELFATHIKVPGDHWNELKRQARSCQLTIYLHLLIANSKLDYQIDRNISQFKFVSWSPHVDLPLVSLLPITISSTGQDSPCTIFATPVSICQWINLNSESHGDLLRNT